MVQQHVSQAQPKSGEHRNTCINLKNLQYCQLKNGISKSQSMMMWSQLSYSLFSESQYGYKALYSSVSNKRHLLPVSDPVFCALSHGTLSYALHGSFYNHFLIGQKSSTANQNLIYNYRLQTDYLRNYCS